MHLRQKVTRVIVENNERHKLYLSALNIYPSTSHKYSLKSLCGRELILRLTNKVITGSNRSFLDLPFI